MTDGFRDVQIRGEIAGADTGSSGVTSAASADLKAARERYLARQRQRKRRANLRGQRASAASASTDDTSSVTDMSETSSFDRLNFAVEGHANVTSQATASGRGHADHATQDVVGRGRPKFWTDQKRLQWQTRLIEWLQEGKSLASFTRRFPEGPNRSTWNAWINGDAIFGESYRRAREDSADYLAEELIEIADEVKDAGPTDSARVNAARLRVDARKWAASKLKPKTYADRVETVASGQVEHKHTITDDQRVKALAILMARQAIQTAGDMVEATKLIEGSAIDVTSHPAETETAPPAAIADQ